MINRTYESCEKDKVFIKWYKKHFNRRFNPDYLEDLEIEKIYRWNKRYSAI